MSNRMARTVFIFMRNWQNNRIYQEGNRTMGEYTASKTRYQENDNTGFYRRCGRSGLKLSSLSLGFWHNFGTNDDYENMKQMCFAAFDHGITHFDLANNYGPVPGSAESNLGRILREEMSAYRDELIISTKAGYDMWEGPYGDWGSKKYLIASLNQSLKRMGLSYVDIFIITEWIQRHHWKRQWGHLHRS